MDSTLSSMGCDSIDIQTVEMVLFIAVDRVLDKQASMLATICLFAWPVRGRCLFAYEIGCLLVSACKHHNSIRA
jgi:hypothetical protein